MFVVLLGLGHRSPPLICQCTFDCKRSSPHVHAQERDYICDPVSENTHFVHQSRPCVVFVLCLSLPRMNPGSAAARHVVFGGTHDLPKVTGCKSDTGNLGGENQKNDNRVQLPRDVVLRMPHQRKARGTVPA